MQINAVGTEDEIFKQVHPIFALYEVYYFHVSFFILEHLVVIQTEENTNINLKACNFGKLCVYAAK